MSFQRCFHYWGNNVIFVGSIQTLTNICNFNARNCGKGFLSIRWLSVVWSHNGRVHSLTVLHNMVSDGSERY